MHRGITQHLSMMAVENLGEFQQFDCVFICVDSPPGRAFVVREVKGARTLLIDSAGLSAPVRRATKIEDAAVVNCPCKVAQ